MMDFLNFKRNFLFTGWSLEKNSKIKRRIGVIESTLMALFIPLIYELIVSMMDSNEQFFSNLLKMRHVLMTVLLFVVMNLRYYFLILKYNKKFD